MKNKTVINASWIIVCRIVQAVLVLLVTMVSARYLGPANYGLVNYASSIVNFLKPVMQLGLNAILVKELIDRPEEEGVTLGTALGMNLVSALVSILCAVSFVSLANPGEKDTLIVCGLYSISLIFLALEMIQYWFQAHLLSKYASLTILLAYIVVSVYKLWLLMSGKSIYWFSVSNSLDYLLIAVSLLVIYKKLGGQSLSFSFARGREMLKRSYHYILSGLMVTIFAQTDKIMLKMLMDETTVGYYSAAISCASVATFVSTAIIDSARPTIFANKNRSVEVFEDSLVKLYSVIIYFSLTVCVGLVLFSKTVVGILYGAAYAETASILRILVWYTTFSYLGSIRNIWILAQEKQQYLWIVNLSGALANVLLNLFLIPMYGAVGAAFATLVTQFFTNVIVGIFIKPIRHSNTLMLRGLNPKWLIKFCIQFLRKR